MRSGGPLRGRAICIAILASGTHPFQEAPEAEARLREAVAPKFDEFLVLRYRVTNVEPYRFEWVDFKATELDYGAILTRISREYTRRFANGKVSHDG